MIIGLRLCLRFGLFGFGFGLFGVGFGHGVGAHRLAGPA
jgi:hypothetical protein